MTTIDEKAKIPPPPKPPKKPKLPPKRPPEFDNNKPGKAPSKIQDAVNRIIGTQGKTPGTPYDPDPTKTPEKPHDPSGGTSQYAKPNPKVPGKKPFEKVSPKPEGRDGSDKKKPPKRRWQYSSKELGGKSLLFTKEGERMRWLCDFSNNFRDRDNPPEILASVAHERFVKEVDECVWPMPELWWWHLDGTRLGQADWLGYDKETGIALAAGYIDKGMESIADSVAHYPEKVGVSHGMILPLLERDQKDESIITRYVTREISALPARAAANTLTEILIGKETNMALTQDKIESLKTNGYSAEQIADVEARNKAKADEAKAAGIESKETEAPVVPDEPEEAAEVTEEVPAETPAAEVVEEAPIEEVDKPVTQKELKETVEALIKGFAEVVKPLQAEINRQGTTLAGVETKALETAKKEMSMTPSAAVGALFAKSFSAIGKDATLTSGRESLAKSGPKEAASDSPLPTFIQRIITPEQ